MEGFQSTAAHIPRYELRGSRSLINAKGSVLEVRNPKSHYPVPFDIMNTSAMIAPDYSLFQFTPPYDRMFL